MRIQVNNRTTAFLLLLGVAVTFGVIQAQLPHQTFWSNDGGEKLVMVQTFIENGLLHPEFPYDPLNLEAEGAFEFAPFLPVHARIIDDRLMPVIPVYFPYLSSKLYNLWGHAGLYVIPIAATLITLFCLIILAAERMPPRVAPLAVIGAGLASPFFFYSLVFFEHTLAACLGIIALTLLEFGRHRNKTRASVHAAAAAFSLSLGVWIRGDVYFLIIGIVSGMFLIRTYRTMIPAFFCGMIIGLAPFYFMNHLLYGSFMGPQVTSMAGNTSSADFSLVAFATKRWGIAQHFLVSFMDTPRINWIFLATATVPAILLRLQKNTFRLRDHLIITWCTLLCLITFTTLGRLFFLDNPMQSTLSILGIFACIPILPFSLVHASSREPGQQADFIRFLFTIMIVTLIGYAMGLPSRGGLQWGPRYLLALYPVMILLAVHGAVRLQESMSSSLLRKVFQILFFLLLVSGICIQLFGIQLLSDKKTASTANITAIRKMNPEVIITDTWWVPEDNADIYAEFPMYTFYTFDKMGALLTRLANKGKREIVLVSSADYRNFIAQQPGVTLTSFAKTDHHKMSLFNLYIHKIEMGKP